MLGVSTRKVDKLVKTMGLEGISKSRVSEMAKSLDEGVEAFRSRRLDAMQIKNREGGRVVNVTASSEVTTSMPSTSPYPSWLTPMAMTATAASCCPAVPQRSRP